MLNFGLVCSFPLKGNKCPQKDMWDLPYLLPLLTWLHVSDYRNVWNTERWKSFDSQFSII